EPGTVVIALVKEKDLCLVLETPESGRVDDAVTIALEIAARAARLLGKQASARVGGIGRVDRLANQPSTGRRASAKHFAASFGHRDGPRRQCCNPCGIELIYCFCLPNRFGEPPDSLLRH